MAVSEVNERTAELYFGDMCVGTIALSGRSADSWHFGRFTPAEAFGRFSNLFGEWSLLIHADEMDDRVSAAAAEELRKVESEIDALRARLHVLGEDRWVKIAQLNIDGPLIEWKVMENSRAR